MATAYQLGELAERLGGEVRGDPGRWIRGVATLDDAGADDLSFLTNPRYRAAAAKTRAAAILVGSDAAPEGPDLLVVAQPYAALARILEMFNPAEARPVGISVDARIGQNVALGDDVYVGPFAVVGDESSLGSRAVVGAGSVVGARCRVGEDSELSPRVVLYPGTRIGRRCLIHAGTVLGADGFGFASVDGRHHKIPQVGHVVVEDDVEIGANCAVDRAMLGETRIGAGSKLDDLVMVAHGVRLGAGSLLAAQSGIAGSARLGRGTVMAGQSGIAGHLDLGDGVVVAAKSAVFRDLKDKAFVGGIPAVDHRRWRRAQAVVKRLPELRTEIREMRARLERLERRAELED